MGTSRILIGATAAVLAAAVVLLGGAFRGGDPAAATQAAIAPAVVADGQLAFSQTDTAGTVPITRPRDLVNNPG